MTPRRLPRVPLAAVALLAACGVRPPTLERDALPTVRAGDDTAGHALTGRVRDDRTDAPVRDAWVFLAVDSAPDARPLRAGRTDAHGTYHLAGAPAGRYFVRIRRAGYLTDTRPVRLGDCGDMVVAGSHVSHCGETRHFYLRSAARY